MPIYFKGLMLFSQLFSFFLIISINLVLTYCAIYYLNDISVMVAGQCSGAVFACLLLSRIGGLILSLYPCVVLCMSSLCPCAISCSHLLKPCCMKEHGALHPGYIAASHPMFQTFCHSQGGPITYPKDVSMNWEYILDGTRL